MTEPTRGPPPDLRRSSSSVDVSKTFGATRAVRDVSMALATRGEIHALVGRERCRQVDVPGHGVGPARADERTRC